MEWDQMRFFFNIAPIGPGSYENEEVCHIPQISSITEASSSDCLASYQGHSLGESYPSAEMQSVYSAAPVDQARILLIHLDIYNNRNNIVRFIDSL